jgi:MFS family permease
MEILDNRKRLLWAGFAAILAAGIGFGIRGGIFANWAAEFGFTGGQLGAIGGAGFTGFCFGIIIGGVVADKIGYGPLVFTAFALHVVSALVTLGATVGQDQNTAFLFLKWGTFIFAVANGTLEAVANPLVATLFPENRTHYLNILHASWPLGMIIGGAVGWTLGDMFGVHWKIQLGLYLIPTLFYGVMFLGQKMPKSAASEKGLSLGEMFKDVGILGGLVVCGLLSLFFADLLKPMLGDNAQKGMMAGLAIGGALLFVIALITRFSIGAWLLFVLFATHALVGAVELGTDGWIQNITGNILSPSEGKILFVWTSLVMFGLRFCAHFIEKNLKLSPVGLLMVCSAVACIGLNLVSTATTFIGAMATLTVYAVGKTFFWPTMLAVTSDRFPRTGAVAISIMGGIGMMSAGLLGSAGLGYAKDRFTAEDLSTTKPAVYAAFKSENTSSFLFFEPVHGLDGKKLSDAQTAKAADRTPEQAEAVASSIQGDRKTLKADSGIPATMAVIYLLILLYFKTIGGYKPITIEDERAAALA